METTHLNRLVSEKLLKRRLDAGLSQQAVAERARGKSKWSAIDQKSVSRIEKNPLFSSFDKLMAYMDVLGMSLTDLTQLLEHIEHPVPQSQIEPLMPLNQVLAELEKCSTARHLLDTQSNHSELSDVIIRRSLSLQYGLKSKRLPITMGIAGGEDSGKSSLINALLGLDLLATSSAPITERPHWIVSALFKPQWLGEQSVVCTSHSVTSMDLVNADVMKQHCLLSGGMGLLAELSQTEEAIVDVVIYVDHPLLEVMTLIELPDFSLVGDSSPLLAASQLEALVFLSRQDAFLKGEDLRLLLGLLGRMGPRYGMEPQQHLLIVSSLAFRDDRDIENSAIAGAFRELLTARLYELWLNRDRHALPLCSDTLSNRVFAFNIHNTDQVATLMSAITSMVEQVAQCRQEINDRIYLNCTETLNEQHKQLSDAIASPACHSSLCDIIERLESQREELQRLHERHRALALSGAKALCERQSLKAQLKNFFDHRDPGLLFGPAVIAGSVVWEAERINYLNLRQLLPQVTLFVPKNEPGKKHDSVGAFFIDVFVFVALESGGNTAFSDVANIVCWSESRNLSVCLTRDITFRSRHEAMFSAVGERAFLNALNDKGIYQPKGRFRADAWEPTLAKWVLVRLDETDLCDSLLSEVDAYWDATTRAFDNGVLKLKQIEASWDNCASDSTKRILSEINKIISCNETE